MTGGSGDQETKTAPQPRLLHPLLFRFLPLTSNLHMHGLPHHAGFMRAGVIWMTKIGMDSAACKHWTSSNVPGWHPEPCAQLW